MKTNEKKPENPQAFPCEKFEPEKGMTLRDYFAAKAMQAILTAMYSSPVPETLSEISKQFDLVAPNSYAFADKMLKQRES